MKDGSEMTDDSKEKGRYVQQVREETHRYISDVLEQNESLRLQLAGAESEVERLREERITLQEKVLTLREKQERVVAEQNRMQVRLANAEAESQRFSARFISVEEHNNNLANLYVATYRLHETVDREEVLTVLEEIIVNLVGSEAFAVFEKGSSDSDLRLATSFGLEDHELDGLDFDRGLIARTMQSRELQIAHGTQGSVGEGVPDVLACVPLRLGEETLGLVVIFRLLPQKPGFLPLDYELLDLLASHAATSLYVSRLRDRVAGSGVAG